jgi:S-adenosylmethionine/arginine decarboxylase-like enzyme
MTHMAHFGYHLMLDCSGCNNNIADKQSIYNFVKELVQRIEMVAHGEPVIEYLLEGDPKQGYSLMQLITTSNITGHFMELDGTAYFDVFSCKSYDVEIVKAVVNQYFFPTKMRVNYLTRDAR